jgi:hypothetical protein
LGLDQPAEGESIRDCQAKKTKNKQTHKQTNKKQKTNKQKNKNKPVV